MLTIESFVPSEVCLACDGCCRYAERDSVWVPLFLLEEIKELTEKNIVPACLFSHLGAKAGGPARIQLVEDKGQLVCACLSCSDNKCKIYEQRPLDCRLYPFLMVKKGGRAYLALDEKCPFARKEATAALKKYTSALVAFLKSPGVVHLIESNPEIIQEYPGDFRILEPLPF